VVIELDKGESESHNEGAYAAFKEVIEINIMEFLICDLGLI